jgi:hypothetical protein
VNLLGRFYRWLERRRAARHRRWLRKNRIFSRPERDPRSSIDRHRRHINSRM